MAEDWRYPLASGRRNSDPVLLITAWNLPAAVIEVVWAAVSVYRLIKHAGRSVRR